ncbi:toxin-antitoxin system YwqK family antitoxin [Nocardioides sp. NPDC057767]|uniref:toxin-antitoxin system YwqK family antitoxin n=1 Tax=unclassified Nocardioides TaxID=2615069 RepID=UPI0036703095
MTEPRLVPDSELDFDEDLVFTDGGKPFTGVAFEESAIRGRSEVTYRDGLQDGPARDWYPSGVLKGESWHVQGVPHGPAREYDESGKLREEATYSHGVRVLLRVLDDEGRIVREERIDPNGEAAQVLNRMRREYEWDEPTDR